MKQIKIVNNLARTKPLLCQVLIDGQFYNVYQYSIDDLKTLEHLEKTEGPITLIYEMILRAMPDCPEYVWTSLSQIEIMELASMIKETIGVKNTVGKGFYF